MSAVIVALRSCPRATTCKAGDGAAGCGKSCGERRWCSIAAWSLPLLAFAGGSVALTLTHRGVRAGRGREAGVLVVALVAWMGAQSANFQVWQRYFEPAILILLAWLIALAPPSLTGGRWLAPLALATGLLAATILLSMATSSALLRAR